MRQLSPFTRIPVSASEPRCSIISVYVICLLIDFHVYMCTLIIKFNSIQKWHHQDLNLRLTDPETDTLSTEQPRLQVSQAHS